MLDAQHLLWTQIAAGVCLLIFAGQLFNLIRMRSQMQAAASWGMVEGIITVSKVVQPPSHVSDDLDDASPVIRYRYHAAGQDLESDRIMHGGTPLMTCVLALRQAARYPVGARVGVYVDPKDASNVLLEPRQKNNAAGLIAFAVVFGTIAAVLTAHSLAGKVLYTANGVPMFAFALPAVAILIAILSLVSFVHGLQLASASARWPTASGTVTASDVIEEEFEDTNNDKSRIRKSIATRSICVTPIRSASTTSQALRRTGDGPASTARAKPRKKPQHFTPAASLSWCPLRSGAARQRRARTR